MSKDCLSVPGVGLSLPKRGRIVVQAVSKLADLESDAAANSVLWMITGIAWQRT